MIDLTFNLVTKVARLVQSVTIKPGGDVPVRVTFSAAPNALTSLTLALGSDATPPAVLAYTEDFTEESETVWTALLDASDTRLVEFMAAKSVATVHAELTAVIDGEEAICPNVPVTAQHRVVSGDPTGEGGPDYYTAAETDDLLPARTVDVIDAAARLALTTATVRAGDFVREIGRAEITKLTCLGSAYTAAVAHVAEWDFTGLVAAAMSETELYMHPDPEGDGLYEAFWFRLDGAGTAPTTFIDGVDGNYRRVDITTGMTAAQIAEAFKLVVAALNTKFSASRTGDVVRVTWVTAGPLYDASDLSTTATLSEVTAGAAATHALGGTMLTLLNGGGASVTVGYSLAGDTGDIAVTLPASTRTAAQVAALTQAAIEAHADFGAVQGTGGATAEVTVTNAARGLVSNGDITAASAGDTGFTVAVLTQGKTGALTYVLVDEDEIAAETGWKELPTLVSFSASNSAGTNQTLATATTSKLNFITQDWDTHAQFDPALKRFICRVPGRYSFSLQCDMASASASSNRKIIQLHKNGTLTKRLIDIAIATGVGADHIIDGTGVLLDLVAGDYIEPYGYASLGATVYFDSAARSFFQALRVGP